MLTTFSISKERKKKKEKRKKKKMEGKKEIAE